MLIAMYFHTKTTKINTNDNVLSVTIVNKVKTNSNFVSVTTAYQIKFHESVLVAVVIPVASIHIVYFDVVVANDTAVVKLLLHIMVLVKWLDTWSITMSLMTSCTLCCDSFGVSGQMFALHDSVWFETPTQSAPPRAGGGFVHVRNRTRVPPPQDLVHTDQAPQSE